MKKAILIFSIILGTIISMNDTVQAQQINISINIGSQPAWGPVGYDYVDYYYLPDINVYYMVNTGFYVYPDGRRWITARYLPDRYRYYDLYNMYKVVFVGGPRNPWIYNSKHYSEYSRYRNYRGQRVIRDSRDHRYNASRNNHASWYRNDKPGREHGNSIHYNERPNNTKPNNNVNNRPNNKESDRRPSSSVRPNNNNNRPSNNNRPNVESSRPSRENSQSNKESNRSSNRNSNVSKSSDRSNYKTVSSSSSSRSSSRSSNRESTINNNKNSDRNSSRSNASRR